MAGISPIDIYRDRIGNPETYVHLHQQSFISAKKANISESMITNEYIKQAKKLENSAMSYFDNITKKDFKDIVNLHKEAYDDTFQDETMQIIFNEFTNNFTEVNTSKSGKKDSASELEDLMNYVDMVIDKMSLIDDVIFDYLGAKDGMRPAESGNLLSLSQTDALKGVDGFKKLIALREKMSSYGTTLNPESIKKSITLTVNSLKGEMMEVISACAKQQALVGLNRGIIADTKITGDLNVDISHMTQELKTLSKSTASSKKIKAKSDSVSVHTEFDPNTGEIIRMGIIGESTKSHPVDNGREVSLVGGTPWSNIMTFAGLINTQFEYLYANSYYHDNEAFKNTSNIMNRYLAAKAASFMFSGVGDSKIPPALFLVGTDKALYLPDLFRDISKGKTKEPTLRIEYKSGGEENKREVSEGSIESQAYLRSKKIVNTLRSDVKFYGKWRR